MSPLGVGWSALEIKFKPPSSCFGLLTSVNKIINKCVKVWHGCIADLPLPNSKLTESIFPKKSKQQFLFSAILKCDVFIRNKEFP